MLSNTQKMEECLELILIEVEHRRDSLEDAIEGYAKGHHGYAEVRREINYILGLVESIGPLVRLRNYYDAEQL